MLAIQGKEIWKWKIKKYEQKRFALVYPPYPGTDTKRHLGAETKIKLGENDKIWRFFRFWQKNVKNRLFFCLRLQMTFGVSTGVGGDKQGQNAFFHIF